MSLPRPVLDELTLPPPISTEQLIRYCSHLEWLNADAVGYIPKPALEKYAARNQILLVWENDDPCGYVLFNDTPGTRLVNARPGTCRIYQACVQYDARRVLHGTEVVKRVILRASRAGLPNVDCYVTDTLPANEFWRALGFHLTDTRLGGSKRGRVLNHWQTVPPPPVPPFFDV